MQMTGDVKSRPSWRLSDAKTRDLVFGRPPRGRHAALANSFFLILTWQQKRYEHVWFFLQSDYRPNFQFPIIYIVNRQLTLFYTFLNTLFHTMRLISLSSTTGCLQPQRRISTTPILLVMLLIVIYSVQTSARWALSHIVLIYWLLSKYSSPFIHNYT